MSIMGAMLAMMLAFQDETGTAVAKPIGEVILEPESGSYFQIFEFIGRPPHSWEHAARMVKGYHYKEREGRLAAIKTSGIHYFLLTHFPDLHFMKMWIGLQVECKETAEITWVDGSSLADQSFRAWNEGTPKKISRTCREEKLSFKRYPVYYESHEMGVRWEIARDRDNLLHMMVEFPVPAEPVPVEPAPDEPASVEPVIPEPVTDVEGTEKTPEIEAEPQQ